MVGSARQGLIGFREFQRFSTFGTFGTLKFRISTAAGHAFFTGFAELSAGTVSQASRSGARDAAHVPARPPTDPLNRFHSC